MQAARNMGREREPRAAPPGVVAIAIFFLAGTVVAAVTGISLLWPGTFLDRLWALNPTARADFASLGRVSGVALLVVAAIVGVAGWGLLRRRKEAWLIAVLIFGANMAGDAARFLSGDHLAGATGLVIAGGLLYYLVRAPIRAYFTH